MTAPGRKADQSSFGFFAPPFLLRQTSSRVMSTAATASTAMKVQ